MGLILRTPSGSFAAAAVLVDEDGAISLLGEDGESLGQAADARGCKLPRFRAGAISRLELRADSDWDGPLRLRHHGREVETGDGRLGFSLNPADEVVLADGETIHARLDPKGWVTSASWKCAELCVAPASFFARLEERALSLGLAVRAPRGRLSGLAERALGA